MTGCELRINESTSTRINESLITINLNKNSHLNYILRLADSPMILGQRLSEWCGHGPILEQDIAITNIALDFIGQARNLYQYAAKFEGKGRTEDDLAFLRDPLNYKNVLLVEQPNGNWGQTIMRQFLYDSFNFYFYNELKNSTDTQISAIAEKSLKEIKYHLRYSSEWTVRLGDGTAESHTKMQNALDDLWMYSGELCTPDVLDEEMAKAGIGVDLNKIRPHVEEKVDAILTRATLQKPENSWMQSGGKQGQHSEHLGFILAEMQFMQRAYPGAEW